jgi:hypothetical protein
MPGMDGTGPLGQGPLTGRGLGPCGAGFRRGFGRGMGRGLGMGRRFALAGQPQQVVFSEADEKKILEQELKELELDKKEIEKRLKELKA